MKKDFFFRGNCKTPSTRKIDDFGVPCQNQRAGSCRSDETILERVGESERWQGAPKGRFCGCWKFCNCLFILASCFVMSSCVNSQKQIAKQSSDESNQENYCNCDPTCACHANDQKGQCGCGPNCNGNVINKMHPVAK